MSWEEFLNPEILRTRLITASTYIAAFEVLKKSVVDRLRFFYTLGLEEKATPMGRNYRSEVLARNRSPVYASLDWLKESGAISDDDINAFESVKELRNEIAHGFPRMLYEGLPSDLPDRFHGMVSLLDKIERWWIANVEATHGTDEDAIIPGPIIGLQLMLNTALGPPELAKEFLDEFIRRTRRPQ